MVGGGGSVFILIYVGFFYISIFQTLLFINGTDTERRTDVESIPLQRHVDVESVLVRCPPNQMCILLQESLQICFIIVCLKVFKKLIAFLLKLFRA